MDFEFGNMPSRAHELFQRLESQGADYVQTLVSAQKSEELFLDYKKIATKDDARSLHDSDRSNLRKALSGFANSEGGVILWGLETAKSDGVEVLKLPEGHPDVARFTSLIEDAVSGCTIPPVPGVRSIKIPLNDDGTRGVVATLVPASLIAPHQTADDARAYYMRAGSSFQRVPHGVLAGMFGRRPSPEVAIRRRVVRSYLKNTLVGGVATLEIALELENKSSVVARNAYISWKTTELCSQNTTLNPHLVPGAARHLTKSDSRNGSVLADENNRLAPYSRTPILNLELCIHGKITEPLDIDIYFGCDSSPPKYYRFYCNKEYLEKVVEGLKSLISPENGNLKPNIDIGSQILRSPVPNS